MKKQIFKVEFPKEYSDLSFKKKQSKRFSELMTIARTRSLKFKTLKVCIIRPPSRYKPIPNHFHEYIELYGIMERVSNSIKFEIRRADHVMLFCKKVHQEILTSELIPYYRSRLYSISDVYRNVCKTVLKKYSLPGAYSVKGCYYRIHQIKTLRWYEFYKIFGILKGIKRLNIPPNDWDENIPWED